jgi:hypothetical protein
MDWPHPTAACFGAGAATEITKTRNTYTILVWKPEGKKALGRPRRGWEDNTEVCVKKVLCEVWAGFIWLRIRSSDWLLWAAAEMIWRRMKLEDDSSWMVDERGFWRRRLWRIWRCYTGISLQSLNKNTETVRIAGDPAGFEPEYKWVASLLLIPLCRSVFVFLCFFNDPLSIVQFI